MDTSKLIDRIYAAGLDRAAWPAAICAIADALGARATSFTIADPEGHSLPFYVAPRTDPEWIEKYAARWARSNIVRDRSAALPLGAIYDFENLGMPRDEFVRSEFYNEFFAPQCLNFALIALAAKEETAVSAVGFYRSAQEGPFDRRHQRLLRGLSPHLHRAVSLNLHLAQIAMQRDSMAAMLNRLDEGAVLVDADGRMLFANVAAEELLRKGEGLRLAKGRLATDAAPLMGTLLAMIANAARGAGAVLSLPRGDGTAQTVEVVPLAETGWLPQPPAAIVFIRNPKATALPSQEEIQQTFDLTPAQAALARELLHGDGIPAAAIRLGISRSTARTHLLELFQRTGTNRQAELVRLVLQRTPRRNGELADERAESTRGRNRAGRHGLSGAWAAIGTAVGTGLLDTLLGF